MALFSQNDTIIVTNQTNYYCFMLMTCCKYTGTRVVFCLGRDEIRKLSHKSTVQNSKWTL